MSRHNQFWLLGKDDDADKIVVYTRHHVPNMIEL